MKNRAHHIEPIEKRIARFEQGSPVESIETLLNSIANYFNNEIALASERKQTSLLFLGIHAAALTISEALWGLRGLSGYRKFLKEFTDGGKKNMKFSLVADKIHSWRNVLAHQWLASTGYEIQYDYDLSSGFVTKSKILVINPKIYCDQYLNAFSADGRIWEYDQILDESELENAKQRIIEKLVRQ